MTSGPPFAFYLPEDPDYTVVDSALDSAWFALAVCESAGDGGLVCRSIEFTAEAEHVRFRGRLLEGVGYLGDSIFAAHWLVRLARVLGRPEFEEAGVGLARHALAAGFFDDPEIPVILYRDTETGEWFHNLEARPAYLELGHVCRVASQCLGLSDLVNDGATRDRLRSIALRTAAWAVATERCPNGWYPRRCTPSGRVYGLAPDSYSFTTVLPADFPPDPLYDRSGAGSLVVTLLAEVTERGLADYRDELRRAATTYTKAGGLFGSTNTDTEDPDDNVSYALGFLAFDLAGRVLGDEALRRFAFERCLGGLARFEIVEDVNGLATKGLLWMDRMWNTSSMWENAMAAQAYLVAYRDRRERWLASKALTILRGMAKHHHGPLGMLTEAVDWDGRFPPARHFPGQRYSDVCTTHTFLNNLYVLEPTVTYLERLAHRIDEPGGVGFYDFEGNRIGDAPETVGGR